MTPELVKYVKTIVAERGISKNEMTKEIMGEVMQEAVRRMDKAITRMMENKENLAAFAAHLYYVKAIECNGTHCGGVFRPARKTETHE